ncbi:MAG TPA: hypothetical protein VHC22_10920 [Pirellulales bacterium]|nr:hypothetical protein [Pirellulales bacterium]
MSITVSKSRVDSWDHLRLGIDSAATVLVVGGTLGLAAALGVDHQPWITATPYVLLAGACAIAFLVGMFILPKITGVTSFDTVKTTSLAGVGVLLVLGVFLAARSEEASAEAERYAEALAKHRQETDAVKASIDELLIEQATLKQQLNDKANAPQVLATLEKTSQELTAYQKRLKILEETKPQLPAGIPAAPPKPGNVGTEVAVANPGNPSPPPSPTPPNPNPAPGAPRSGGAVPTPNPTSGTPGAGTPSGGTPPQPSGGGGRSNKGGDEMKAAIGIAAAFLAGAQPVLIIVKALLPKLLSLISSVEDLKPILEAVRLVVEGGGVVPPKEVLDKLAGAKEPGEAAAAFGVILADKSFRKLFKEEDLKVLDEALKNYVPSTPPSKDPPTSSPEKTGKGVG